MIRVDFNNLINDNFLNIIYNYKFKSIYKESIYESKINTKQKNNYINILYAIDNVPPCFNSTRKNIKSKVDTYVKCVKELDYYKNLEFYKAGFRDGYTFLLELLSQEMEDNTNE